MGQAISTLLSPAVGVMISPFPIVGLILILLSDKARPNSIAYLLGWFVGNAVIFTIAMLCMGAGTGAQSDPSTLVKIIFIVLGALLILAAVHEFSKRPKVGEEPKTPKWFAKMSEIAPKGAAGFGFILSALNPKNALLSISAGAGVGALHLAVGQEIASVFIFTLIASALIIVPTIAFLVAGHRLDKFLDSVRGWLVQNNAVIMSVLLLLIGINILSKAF